MVSQVQLRLPLMKIKSPFIGYMDADLQTFPDDFEKLLKCRFDAGLSLWCARFFS